MKINNALGFLLALFLQFSCYDGVAQVLKFRAEWFAYSDWNKSLQDWNKFGELKPSEVLIVMKLEAKRIDVYAGQEFGFDILEIEQVDDTIGEELVFICVDDKGSRCAVKLVKGARSDVSVDIFIVYPEAEMVYYRRDSK